MATVIPPQSKRQKREAQKPVNLELAPSDLPNVTVRFQAADSGEVLGGNIRVPATSTERQLEQLLNQLQSNDEAVPYTFSLLSEDGSLVEISDIYNSVLKPNLKSTEDNMTLVYTPRAVFKVRAVTRSSAEIPGHSSTILCAQFAPHTSSRMVTGAGDSTARIWDCNTQTPMRTLTGHTDWVLAAAWSPDGKYIATGSKDSTIRIWDPKTGSQIGQTLKGHSKYVGALSWEPLHLVAQGGTPRLASASKDGTIRVWDIASMRTVFIMSGHKSTVSCVKWGGLGDIYSGSHDKTIKVWSSKDGRLVNTLISHAHWINHIALSTDYALRTGPFGYRGNKDISSESEYKQLAQSRFEQLAKIDGKITERLVSASDDLTMYLWEPAKNTKPLCRMTGHQKIVNHVSFSPDGTRLASASFDNSIKLWNARDGKFLTTCRGHVAAVYQCAWSADSRLLVSGSKDTTLKIWDARTGKLHTDLPGHKDEVYAVDWSGDGQKVASGGKDKMVRLWAY